MARQTRATSRSSAGSEGKSAAVAQPDKRGKEEGQDEQHLSAVSTKSKKIKKRKDSAPDGLLQMRAQLSRMEARIEAVEEELRQEKQKNAALQQKQLEPISSHCGAGDVTRSLENSFEIVNTPPTSGLGEDDTTAGSDDSLNSGGLQSQRKRSSSRDCSDQAVTPVKRRKQQQDDVKGGLEKTREVVHRRSTGLRGPRTTLTSPVSSRSGARVNSGRLRSAAVAASAAVASAVAGRRRIRRRNCIVSANPTEAGPAFARAPPNSPNGDGADIPRDLSRIDEERHVCTLRCPASCQGQLRPTDIIVYEGFSAGFELISGSLQIPTTSPPRLQVVRGSITEDLEKETLLEVPARVRMLLNQPKVPRNEALEHGWNPADCSFNLNLKFGDPFTVKRRPVAQSTDCVRGKKSYTRGVHAWGLRWPKGERGTHAVVGVANNEQVLHCVGYRSLVGSGVHSWGWDLGRASAYHGGEGRPYPRPNFTVPDTFTMVLDLEAGSLAFKVDDTYLGPAFSGLKGPLYPVISSVWGNSEVTLIYRGSLEPKPLSLQQLAREEITRALDGRSLQGLGLPTRLRRFLLYQE